VEDRARRDVAGLGVARLIVIRLVAFGLAVMGLRWRLVGHVFSVPVLLQGNHWMQQ
jgi:hypothetical protein